MLSQTFPQDSSCEDDALKLITLTPEQLQSVFTWLKNSFPGFSIQKIVSALDHYYHEKYHNQAPRTPKPPLNINRERNQIRMQTIDFQEDNLQKTKIDKQQKKKNQLKLLSQIFCQKGYGYHHVRQIIPNIQQYSNLRSKNGYKNSIMSIINKIMQDLLRKIKQKYYHDIEVTIDQKSRIRQQLIHAHKWMGKVNPQALATFLKLINRHFQKAKTLIQDHELLALYNTIEHRINNNLNQHQIEQPRQEPRSFKASSLNFQIEKNQKVLGSCFIQNKTIIKTLAAITTQQSSQSWTLENVKEGIQSIIKKSVQKLVKSFGKENMARRILGFNSEDQLIYKQIMINQKVELKIELVRYYIEPRTSKQEDQKLLELINEFMDIRAEEKHLKYNLEQYYSKDGYVQRLIE